MLLEYKEGKALFGGTDFTKWVKCLSAIYGEDTETTCIKLDSVMQAFCDIWETLKEAIQDIIELLNETQKDICESCREKYRRTRHEIGKPSDSKYFVKWWEKYRPP
jgi:hypothetical protein